MQDFKLHLEGIDYQSLFTSDGLAKLDGQFLSALKSEDALLHDQLLGYRHQTSTLSATEVSELICDCSRILETFVAKMYGIRREVSQLQLSTLQHDPIFLFKNYFVKQKARRRISKKVGDDRFPELDAWLTPQIDSTAAEQDRELAVATYAANLLDDEEKNAEKIDQLIDWCVAVLTETAGQNATKDWVSFKLPQKMDYQELVPTQSHQENNLQVKAAPQEKLRQRDGFNLTDARMSTREVQDEVHYCVYCHDKEGDFCSKGFPVKKKIPELGLKKNSFDEYQTGCPLEEKISEMNLIKREGYGVAALAIVMIDNPMCAVTGHRICNDCMKACIYQKQDPVNIPEIETRVLTDVLELPWGVEIYDLLTRWNPLRQKQFVAKTYNGLKALVMGMGPAGFSLAHHLLMEGFSVVGVDGLKIEPLPEAFYNHPIYNFNDIKESLDDRIMAGFGGVAEYGITARWDKNFLKLIYISLMRHPRFAVYGGVRFGGTVKVEDAWELGFDHLAVAVGAGLPRELPIKNSMAPGMRQANDFLMALQLTGAAKSNSLANLQVRLPAVVIGGGLTGVDTATEVQAYYIKQVEKVLHRYEKLLEVFGDKKVHAQFPEMEFEILHEFLTHARTVRQERQLAKTEQRAPDFIKLIRQWGGVTIVYRRTMQESPAYKRNHEELIKALDEGVFYVEHLQPTAVRLDDHGHVQSLVSESIENKTQTVLPTRSIFVATGAKPNIAYEFEHRGTFHTEASDYKAHENVNEQLQIVHPPEHIKAEHFGAFTSYEKDSFRVSFLGDTHPVFHGSVVKAIASAQRIYPKILESFGDRANQVGEKSEFENFASRISKHFSVSISKLKRLNNSVIEMTVIAPAAAKNFRPGQFYRVQNFETRAKLVDGTLLQSEATALIGLDVNKESGEITFLIEEKDASTKLFATFNVGDPISVMGPTGVRIKIPKDQETVLILGDKNSIAHVRSIGKAMRDAGNRLIYLARFNTRDEIICPDELEEAADQIVWVTDADDFINSLLEIELAQQADRVFVIGEKPFLDQVQKARANELKNFFVKQPLFIASVYGPMQCMLKGVCAQCLQWQIDPETGERTKAVYACSWQDQPMDIIDFDNINDRLAQNRCQQLLTNLWLDYLMG